MNKKQLSGKRKTSPGKKRTSPTRRSGRLTRDDMAALEQLDHLLELQRRREQLAASVPPGIRTNALPLPGGGRVYFFVHERLGMLGNLILSPAGGDETQVSVELAPGDPDAPEWAEQYELFNQVATICLNALPGGDGTKALPSLEEARAQRRLYQRFVACQHSIEMFGFVKSLSEQDYQQLLAVIQTALITAKPTDRAGIEQRLGELRFYWNDLQARPTV